MDEFWRFFFIKTNGICATFAAFEYFDRLASISSMYFENKSRTMLAPNQLGIFWIYTPLQSNCRNCHIANALTIWRYFTFSNSIFLIRTIRKITNDIFLCIRTFVWNLFNLLCIWFNFVVSVCLCDGKNWTQWNASLASRSIVSCRLALSNVDNAQNEITQNIRFFCLSNPWRRCYILQTVNWIGVYVVYVHLLPFGGSLNAKLAISYTYINY